jgi:hypothetical protein
MSAAQRGARGQSGAEADEVSNLVLCTRIAATFLPRVAGRPVAD